MHVRCPHCRNPIELVDDGALDEVDCPSCGSSFSLVGTDSTATYTVESDTLGHFTLSERLGIGAFGTVWKAHDTELDRTVAVKVPRKGQLNADETEKFLREARAAAQLKHPNIVSVHEVGRDGETVYIVSDLVDGLTLTDWLTGYQPSPQEAAQLCIKLAEALHHAHERGVIHRDLKPGNVMLDRANEPHIMDFGLAKREAGEVTMTMDGQILGTPAYMSPEQARGEGHDVDRRSDVYSLGVILFELLTGERPFRGNSRMLIHQLLTEDAPSPRRLNASIPRDLETICLKCLEKDPGGRYGSADDLRRDLQNHLDHKPIAARPIGAMARGWRWCKRKPSVAGLSFLLLISFAMGTAISSWYAVEADSRADELSVARSNLDDSNRQLEERNSELASSNVSLEEAARAARQQSHLAKIRWMQLAWDQNNLSLLRDLLEQTKPQPGEADLRDYEWHFWNELAHAERATIALPPSDLAGNDHKFQVGDVAYSPDGKYLAAAYVDYTRPPTGWASTGVLLVMETSSWETTLTQTIRASQLYRLEFSPDGQRLIIADRFRVWIVDLGTGDMLFEDLFTGNGQIDDARLTADGQDLYVALAGSRREEDIDDFRRVEIRHLETGDVEIVPVEFEGVSHMTLSPTCERLVFRRADDDGAHIHAMQITDPSQFWTHTLTESSYSDQLHIEFHGDDGGELAVIYSANEQGHAVVVEILDGATGELRQTLRVMQSQVDDAPASYGDVHYDFQRRRLLVTELNASRPNRVSVFDMAAGKQVDVLYGHTDEIRAVSSSPDGTTIVTASDDRTLRIWDAPPSDGLFDREAFIEKIPLSEDRFALWYEAGIVICNERTNAVERIVDCITSDVYAYRVSPDRRVLAMLGDFGEYHIVDVITGETILAGRFSHESTNSAVTFGDCEFSPDGTLIVMHGSPGTIIADLIRREVIISIPESLRVAFVPNQRQVLLGRSDGRVELWDLELAKRERAYHLQPTELTALAVSPNGSMFASAGTDRTIRVCVTATGTVLQTLQTRTGVSPLYDAPHFLGGESGLAFNQAGTRLLSVHSADSHVWDARTGQEVLSVTTQIQRRKVHDDFALLRHREWIPKPPYVAQAVQDQLESQYEITRNRSHLGE